MISTKRTGDTKMTFRELVEKTNIENPAYRSALWRSLRTGFKEAYAGNVASRNARFMCWMHDRKDDYVAMRRYNVQKNYCTGGYSILDQDDFTDFIVSGEWIK
ncbi:hypothetical protein STSR3_37 [Salmonella virus STSR3]|nr:hypothetical protein STSR3_37 [Salmonella virus STSR3]